MHRAKERGEYTTVPRGCQDGQRKASNLLRITVEEHSGEGRVLVIEGDLVGAAVGTLAEEGGALAVNTPWLVLDLAGVRSVDAASMLLMRQWSDRLTLRQPSQYVLLLLRQYGLAGCVHAAEEESGTA